MYLILVIVSVSENSFQSLLCVKKKREPLPEHSMNGEELPHRVGEVGCPVAELCQVVTEAPQKVN